MMMNQVQHKGLILCIALRIHLLKHRHHPHCHYYMFQGRPLHLHPGEHVLRIRWLLKEILEYFLIVSDESSTKASEFEKVS